MFLLCGVLPIADKSQMEKKEEATLMSNLLPQHGGTTLSSTGVYLLPKILPAAWDV